MTGPPEIRTGDPIGYTCDACQDLHRDVVVFRPVGDEVRMCKSCLREGLALFGLTPFRVTHSTARPVSVEEEP